MKKTLLALLLCQIGQLHAQEAVPAFSLGQITVSSDRGENLYASDSLDSEQIRQTDRETVGTAVAELPGVSLSKVGARNEEMVYVRGFDLRQVPIYVDGIPVYVPYDGYVDLGRFNTYDLARIDVAKGFSSMLYGANTLGGAINLVSRRPSKAFEGEVGGGLALDNSGDRSSYHGYTNLGSNQGQWYVQASASYRDQDHFRLPDSFDATSVENGDRRDNSYATDRKYNLKLGLTPNATDEYALNYINQHGTKGTPPYAGTSSAVKPRYWQWPYWDKESLYFLSSTQIGAHTLKLRAYHDTFENSLYSYDDASYTTISKPYAFRSWYDDYTDGFSVEGDLVLSAANTLKAAWNWKTDVHREHNAGEPLRHFKDRTQSLALEDTHRYSEALSFVAGLSYDTRKTLEAEDYNSKTGAISDFQRDDDDAFNAQFGAFYQLTPTGKLHATLARKSRFPTIKDRYSYRLGTAIPNADLKSERANHYEVGYSDLLAGNFRWQANLFHSNISNLIQSTRIDASACTSAPCSQMQNVGKARANGIELGIDGGVGAWEFRGNYTYLNRQNRSDPSVKLTDTPRNQFFGYAAWKHAAWTLSGNLEAASGRWSASDGSQRAGGFAVAGVKAGYKLAQGSTIEAGVSNVFDRLYAYSEGYPEAGRTYFVQFNAPL